MLDTLAVYGLILYIVHKLICHALRQVKLAPEKLKASYVVVTGCDTGFGNQVSLRLQVKKKIFCLVFSPPTSLRRKRETQTTDPTRRSAACT